MRPEGKPADHFGEGDLDGFLIFERVGSEIMTVAEDLCGITGDVIAIARVSPVKRAWK